MTHCLIRVFPLKIRLPVTSAIAILLATSVATLAAETQPTAAEAKAVVDKAEADLARMNEYAGRAAWVKETYITDDTNWLSAKANAEQTDLQVKYAKEAARFDGVEVDPVVKRKLYLLKCGLTLPASSRPGASQELADIEARLDTDYSTAKFDYKGRTLTLDDMEDILRTSRDPAETKALWEGWRAVSSPRMRADYANLVALANEGSREIGYKDTGALWRSWYDMDPNAFAAETDRLWRQVEPFYKNLHCYVRARLNEKYGDAVQPRTGSIRGDLTGNMWGQGWGNIYDIVAPKTASLGYDVTDALTSHSYSPLKMVQTSEAFYTSIGFAPLPESFWMRSMFTRPGDREVVCHPSAWDVDDKEDLRLKACFTVTADDFYSVYHELGHNMYQRAYAGQPFLFKGGANDGFHEAIGDFAALNAITPTYLKKIGLIDTAPGTDADIPHLLKIALDKVAFLPFALLVDKWRWEVFSGQVTPEHYNDAWWALVKQYQGLTPPGPRPGNAFDPGAKFHIASSTPYMRYFLADIYEFQFYRAACRQARWKGPLNRCSIYEDKEVGKHFAAMLAMGQSQPWPEALVAFTGEKALDASAIADYFAPLNAWLTEQNKSEACGG